MDRYDSQRPLDAPEQPGYAQQSGYDTPQQPTYDSQPPAYDTAEPRLGAEQAAALDATGQGPESIADPAIPGGPTTFDAWRYRDTSGVAGTDVVGYKVEATDGGIGKIDQASHEVDASYLVVDTGPWIFGKKVMLPAGVVDRVDHDEQVVYVDRPKDQIKAAPEYDETSHTDSAFRDKLGGYYGESYDSKGETLPPGRV